MFRNAHSAEQVGFDIRENTASAIIGRCSEMQVISSTSSAERTHEHGQNFE